VTFRLAQKSFLPSYSTRSPSYRAPFPKFYLNPSSTCSVDSPIAYPKTRTSLPILRSLGIMLELQLRFSHLHVPDSYFINEKDQIRMISHPTENYHYRINQRDRINDLYKAALNSTHTHTHTHFSPLNPQLTPHSLHPPGNPNPPPQPQPANPPPPPRHPPIITPHPYPHVPQPLHLQTPDHLPGRTQPRPRYPRLPHHRRRRRPQRRIRRQLR
jgi:hypothetical protein